MKVKQVMLENPKTLHYTNTLNDAVKLYKQNNVNCAPVMDDEKNVLGILTVFRLIDAVRAGADFNEPVDQVMDKNLHIVDEDTSFSEISNKPIDRLIILNNQKRLTGVLTKIDLINKVHNALINTEVELSETTEVNKELRSIIEAFYDAVIVVDNHGLVLMVNNKYFRLQGHAKDISGEHVDNIDIDEHDKIIQVYHDVIKSGKVSSIKYQSEQSELVLTASPVLDENNHPIRVIITIRDLTELNKLKLQSEKAFQELNSLRAKEQKDFIYKSNKMVHLVNKVLRVSRVDSTVLITGESGVGKEVIAKSIHRNSYRSEGPFIQINCGAIPEHLIESELFGYEKGAFTGANKEGKPGMMELANGGTLLLDEVGDLPLNLQVKLLRALQEQEIFRIGGRYPIKLDIRILAATNKDLSQLIKENKFREDLFYRLNVVPIHIPSLRERWEDILPLAMYNLDKFNHKYNMTKTFSSEVCRLFEKYSWPGNVRELSNQVERLVIMSDSNVIEANQLPDNFFIDEQKIPFKIKVDKIVPLKDAREALEMELINLAFKKYGSLRSAGEALGVAHSTLLRKARSLGISLQE
ncbi:MAG: CBS domain-containing protein [Firmicutes bacterium]|nr:CBS domain-containing protein [Bacillota bacterium]